MLQISLIEQQKKVHGNKFAYQFVGDSTNYQRRYERAMRIKKRWANDKIRVNEIPADAIEEMKELQQTIGVSYEKIGKLFGISRYMVWKALDLNKELKETC